MERKTLTELFDLRNKGVVVTGAARGIGRAIAMRLAEAGAGVAIADINREAASQTAGEIRESGGRAMALRTDTTDPGAAVDTIEAAVKEFGHLDIFVNNAAVFPPAILVDMPLETWDVVMNTNLRGVFINSQAAARQMIKQGSGGKIINISSVEGLHPNPFLGHYDSAKAGVIMLTKALALELAPHRILVNTVAPGGIKTPGLDKMLHVIFPGDASMDDLTNTFMVNRVPVGRMGEPDDIAKMVVCLASGCADYMTGSVVVVDGGNLLS